MKPRNWLLSHVGETPLVRLRFLEHRNRAQIWCKLEFMNPGGSCKDRMCLSIVESMEAEQILRPGDSLLEASCGNTAISLAVIAAAKAYGLILVMPDNCPQERKTLLEAYGAQIHLTPSSNGMKGSVSRAVEILDSSRRTFMINQFENPANPEAHRRTTAVEILRDLGKVPDVFVCGVGTGGTITGVGEVLKETDRTTRVVAVEPAESPILSGGNPGPHGIPGIGPGFIPRVLNTDIIDDVATVTFEEASEAVRKLAKREGIYAGLSSGANLHAALRQAERLDSDKTVVTVLCDTQERYSCFNL